MDCNSAGCSATDAMKGDTVNYTHPFSVFITVRLLVSLSKFDCPLNGS